MKRELWVLVGVVLFAMLFSALVARKALAKHPLQPDHGPYSTNY